MRSPIAWVVGAGLLLGLPVLVAGFPLATHDGYIHGVWLELFAKQFWSGDVYPRWLQDLDGGLGGPSFYFYPPVPYFVAAVFQPLFGPSRPWHALGASAVVALVLSGVFAYLWLREAIAARHAAIAAVVFMMMPYHFAVDLHVRGAFAEFWSFAWLPAMLFFTRRIADRKPWSMLGLSGSYAALIMTHLPTTLIFSVIPPAYALWIAAADRRVRTAIEVCVAMAVGMGLSSIYLLPAMLDQSPVSINAMHSGDAYYENWFFFARDPNGVVVLGRTEFVRALFWMLLSMLAIGAIAWTAESRASETRRQLIFWSAVTAVAASMTLPISRPIYDLVSPLQIIQFPWRFTVIVTVAVTALIGIALDAGVHRFVSAIGAAIVIWWIVFTVDPLRVTSFNRDPVVTPRVREWLSNKSNTPEYRTKWLHLPVDSLIRQLRGDADTIARAIIVHGAGRVSIHSWKPRDVSLTLDTRAPTTVEVRQFYYPNWVATANGSAPIALTPAPVTGLMRVDVPAGTETVDIRLESSAAERGGTAITLVSLVVCVVVVVAGLVRARTARQGRA